MPYICSNSTFKKFLLLIVIFVLCLLYKIDQLPASFTQNETLTTSKNHPTIFCLIKTHPNNIKINKTLLVYKIWAHKCDNYRFITRIPEELVPGDVDTKRSFEVLSTFHMLQPEGLGDESHGNLTLKMYYTFKFIYAKFPDYDWYDIIDDDAYVNINNFKKFLRDKNPKEPVTYGFNYKVIVRDGYHSGGPGYVMSNEAFTRISKALNKNISTCPNSGIDDIDINSCLRDLNVSMGISYDEQKRERFINMGLMTHFTGSYPPGHSDYSFNPPQKVLDII